MLKSNLLQRAEKELLNGVKDHRAFSGLVSAGRTVIDNQQIFKNIAAQLTKSDKPVRTAARSVVFVMGALSQKVKGKVPAPAFVQAGTSLLYEILDDLEQAGVVKVDEKTLAQGVGEYIESVMPIVGLTPEVLGKALATVKQTMQDQQRMEAYRSHLGVNQ
jgi:hypothetical protein